MRKELHCHAGLRLSPLRRIARFLNASLWLTLAILGTHRIASANPYLAKPGERPTHIRIATCAVSGGFAHLYTALENNLFDKYGFKVEHVFIRGSGPALAALMADEIQFLYCVKRSAGSRILKANPSGWRGLAT